MVAGKASNPKPCLVLTVACSKSILRCRSFGCAAEKRLARGSREISSLKHGSICTIQETYRLT